MLYSKDLEFYGIGIKNDPEDVTPDNQYRPILNKGFDPTNPPTNTQAVFAEARFF